MAMSIVSTEHLYIEKDPNKYEGKAVIKGTSHRYGVRSLIMTKVNDDRGQPPVKL